MKIITLLLIVLSINIFAQNIKKEAENIALNYFAQNNKSAKKHLKIDNARSFSIKNEENDTLMFVFHFKNTKGFVITSANKNAKAVLAYSDETNFDKTNIPPAVKSWLKHYKKQLNFIKKHNIKNFNNQKTWEVNYIKAEGDTMLGPLLTSKWNQGKYYNTACPVDSAGIDFHTVTGCVATATGQILYYYRFPTTGTGSYTYDCPNYGTISVDYSSAHYNYNEMADEFTNYSESGAELLFHLGVSFDMEYGPDGSAVWNHSVANSLRTYFKYGSGTQYLFRDSTTLNWDSIVYVNLVHNKPLYYGGWEDTTFQSGHAFVCDGYKAANFYHFNWGWGGAYDGYYYTDNLTPAGSQFSYCQEMIKDIYPDTVNYEYNNNLCQQTDTLTGFIGSMQAGNFLKNYDNNQNCKWTIQPKCAKLIEIKFDRFNLNQGDTVKVNSYHNTQWFTADNPPSTSSITPTVIKSINGIASINFVSDDSLTDSGWQASFTTKKCSYYGILFTDSAGVISDGSGICNYDENTHCRWTIEPENANAILLEFTEFSLDENNDNDYLKIYKNSQTEDSLVAELHHFDSPSQYFIPAGKVIVKFETHFSSSGEGWTINYRKVPLTGIENITGNIDWNIKPNPAKDYINLPYIFNKNTKYEVYDISGKKLLTGYHTNGNKINIERLQKGIYFIKIANYTKKFIKD